VETAGIIAAHEAAGRRFHAAGTTSFVREEGDGEPVVLMHGVPTSSYLYRKVLPEIAARGLRGVAFDLPGLGMADRPQGFDYSWSGLARWTGEAIDALGIKRCHLVVHDIGGPIGFEWAISNRDRILSLTALNTLVDVARFRRPWSMHPFSVPRLGEAYLRTMTRFAFVRLFYLQGIGDRAAVSRDEIGAHYDLLKRGDGGRAFLRIMRGFELTDARESLFRAGLAERSYPAQVVWGRRDRALGERRRLAVQDFLSGSAPVRLLDAKHFLQEDRAPEIAAAVSDIARAG
jgi:pimeloyl-ACP methyl ester carboxylesterase